VDVSLEGVDLCFSEGSDEQEQTSDFQHVFRIVPSGSYTQKIVVVTVVTSLRVRVSVIRSESSGEQIDLMIADNGTVGSGAVGVVDIPFVWKKGDYTY